VRRALLCAALATALGWLALGTRADFPAERIGTRTWSGDFLSYYLPNAEYLGLRLAAGELPLWDPRHGAGAPFLASLQAGALYPPNLLHALLPAPAAFAALLALHLALAVAAAGALAARLGAGVFGALLAGLAYATSLRVLGESWTPPLLYTSAWAPALCLAVEGCLSRPRVRNALWLALALGLPLLAGWPYGTAIAALGAGLYAALRLAGIAVATRRAPGAQLAALAAGGALGAALAAPQLLPALELLRESCRALGSLVPEQAIFVGAPHQPADFARALRQGGMNDGVPSLLALALAPLALLPGPGRARVAALLAVGLFGLLASFPDHTPVYGWLRGLPVLGDFRFPFRYRLLTSLALAVAAGVGATRLLALCARRRGLATAAGCALLALQLLSATRPELAALAPFPRAAPPAAYLADWLEAQGAPAGGRVLRAGWSGRLRGADRARIANDLEPLSLARSARLLTFFETGRAGTLSRTSGPRVPPATVNLLEVPYYGRIGLPDTPERAAILDLFSVSRLVSEDPPDWLAARYARVEGAPPLPRADGAQVFANPGALPRARRVGSARPEPRGLETAVAALLAPGRDPRRDALLDRVPPELAAARGAAAEGEVEIALDAPERVLLRTRGERAAAVVLADAWFPGWEVRVDGARAEPLRADTAFRAVAVPPGAHEIEWRYRPRSLRAGAALAALAVLGGAAALALERRLSRARPRPTP
jgi:hypothetical protein